MTTVREIKDEDFGEVMRIGNRYSAETLLGELSDEQVAALLSACMRDGIVLAAVKDDKLVGIIGGKFVDGFAMGKFFEEVVWYVEPEHRGMGLMLFSRMIELCQAKGCTGVCMSAYNNKYLKHVDRFYKRNGFKEVERRYYKKF